MANLDVLARAYGRNFYRMVDLEQMVFLAERNNLPRDIRARLADMHDAAKTNHDATIRVAENAGFTGTDLAVRQWQLEQGREAS